MELLVIIEVQPCSKVVLKLRARAQTVAEELGSFLKKTRPPYSAACALVQCLRRRYAGHVGEVSRLVSEEPSSLDVHDVPAEAQSRGVLPVECQVAPYLQGSRVSYGLACCGMF